MTYTTQQLQAMSDFEVNKALHLWLLTRKPKEGLESITYRPSGAFDVRFKSGANFLSHLKDYCKNHNDIMPLAFERRIAIFPYGAKWISVKGHSWIDFNGPHEELAPIDTDGEYFMSESPLRAIACLLLMVED